MLRIFKVLRELKVYRDYLKLIKKESLDSPLWSRRNLRKDWVGRIYTVVNLPPQVIFATDVPKEARPSFVISEIKPINDYLKSLNLEEVLTMYINPIEGSNDESYLVVYQYFFRNLSLLWILRFIVEVSLLIGLIFTIYRFGHNIF
jgi:hypothetical protein